VTRDPVSTFDKYDKGALINLARSLWVIVKTVYLMQAESTFECRFFEAAGTITTQVQLKNNIVSNPCSM